MTCERCGGKGQVNLGNRYDHEWHPCPACRHCPACNGNGLVSTMNPFGNETTYRCPDCRGSGLRPRTEAT